MTTNNSLYVGDLTEAVTEAILYEIFREVGPLLSIRVCRDAVTKKSLGYAYVNFQNHQDAERALDTLNYTVVKGRPIRIMWSIRDPSVRKSGIGNIFIKNLDKSIDNKALYDTFSAFGNILSCKVSTKSHKEDAESSAGSRGYGFVHFETQEAAEQAIAKVNGMLLNGKKVFVGPFIKRNERLKSFNADEKYTNVYAKNLDKNMTTQELEQLFSEAGKIQHAEIMLDDHGKSKGFGFVNFEKHEDAKKAVEIFNNKDYKGKKLFVGRAQKKNERIAVIKDFLEKKKLDKQTVPQGVNLYVKNLDDTVDDVKLKDIFSKFGSIVSAKVMIDDKDGTSKGFGFVSFGNADDGQKAMAQLNGTMIFSKPLYVNVAQKREIRRAQLEAQHRSRQQGYIHPMGHMSMHAPPQAFGIAPHPNAFAPPLPQAPFYPQPMHRPFISLRPRWQVPPPQMMAQVPQQQQSATITPSTSATSPTGTTPLQANASVPRPYGNMPMAYAQAVARGGPSSRGGPSKNRGGAVHMGHHQQGYAVPPQQQGRTQRFKYNQNARNRPPEHMLPPQHVQQMVMVPNQIIQQAPIMVPQPADVVPVASDQLTLSNLAEFSPEEQKNIIGDRLFPLVHVTQPEHAGKITGMLLEMEISDLLHLIESPDTLSIKVAEALAVLQQHSQPQQA